MSCSENNKKKIFLDVCVSHSVVTNSYTLCNPMDCSPPVPHPLSMEFSRQQYWSGLPFPSPEDLPDLGIEPRSPICRWIRFLLSHKGNPRRLEWVSYPCSRGTSRFRNPTGVSCIAEGFVIT